MEGSYSSDFLYYMNEGGIRTGSTLGPTGSPSRLMTTASGDGSPYDMLEQEEVLYTENFPGKHCSLCNLSERSTLGQGDIVKFKITNNSAIKAIEDKRGKGLTSDATSENDDASSDKSPKSLANARRKGRKITSGDTYEPIDELENIGYMEEPELGLLFENSGNRKKLYKNLTFQTM